MKNAGVAESQSRFGPLELATAAAYLRHRETRPIREMAGFVRGRHRLPTECGVAAERFVQQLAIGQIAEEIGAVYSAAKRELGLRRRQLVQATAEGGGNVDAPSFRYALEVGQGALDPTSVRWRRELRLLHPPSQLPPNLDRVFPAPFDELVIPFTLIDSDRAAAFDRVVERLEDFGELHGGEVIDTEREARVSLVTDDGSRLEFDLGTGELAIRVHGFRAPLALMREATRRFAIHELDQPRRR